MVSRKRARDEMEAEAAPYEPSTLQKLRSMWQFSNLMQYINLFGDALKIDKEFDIEDLEGECLKPHPSEKLANIGLALLKHVSSHKGLTLDIFDEYARRQYVAKAPHINPFGAEEAPNKFNEFDIFTKIRVLQQLSVWTLNNPNSIRERINASDNDQTLWRMEPTGWDSEERAIFVLDDNRLYRRTDPPAPPPPYKAKSKAKSRKSRGTRNSKRRKQSSPEPEDVEEEEGTAAKDTEEKEDDGFGGMKWECLCITLEDYQEFMNSIRRSRDPNEKALYERIKEDVLPIIQAAAEEQAKKEARRLKELEVLQKLATAKRSSRISSRLEKQKEQEEAAEAERRRQTELAMAQAEQEKQRKMEEARESRMMTREQRVKEREAKRILHEEELRKLKEDSEKLDANEARLSERHLKAEMKRRQEELQKLSEEDEWVFDCEVCGLYGENLDDGSHSIACEKCSVWQHSKCHGITEAQAERDDFHFVCKTCTRKEEGAQKPKLPPLKLRLTSTSPNSRHTPKGNGVMYTTPLRRLDSVQTPTQQPPIPHYAPRPTPQPTQPMQSLMNGPSLSPRGQALGPPGIHRSEVAYGSPAHPANGSSSPVALRPYTASQARGMSMANGFPTSSPPQYQTPRVPSDLHSNYNLPHPQANGNTFGAPNPFVPAPTLPYATSFNQPASSQGTNVQYQSPVKHSPAPSPQPTNGLPNTYSFTHSPHSSFPPSSAQRLSFSPTKHSSPPPPPPPQISSPAPALPHFAPSPSQMPAQMLPSAIPAPEKHDAARPVSSHSISETPILPPIKSLSPSLNPQILSPPTKRQSPTPERPQFAQVSGNGFGGAQ
ncbi:uncharacterized protein BDR25DRAFT_333529 [Lindgomyces ingoldianus]|uniref:Uncharacterized protein n=1 Tax=Lindgomyces ingoldianus TaxID=673940 RepID=A0ACB6QZ36_9PLEO|nr:uncharacterized protein BDR25DRAFT_333529 [Lindgomyces ingoldianus]KAF2472110.1 hypothetical protein BDR25DRAFT_333529 [Lindgomyces ingoldianus]